MQRPPPLRPQPNQYRLRLSFKRERVDRPADPILFLAEYFELFEAEQTAIQVKATAAPACSSLTCECCSAPCTTSSSPPLNCPPTCNPPPPPHTNVLRHAATACCPHSSPSRGRDNLFQAFTIQTNALRRTLVFADLLPLAAQLLDGLPSHVMQVVKMVR